LNHNIDNQFFLIPSFNAAFGALYTISECLLLITIYQVKELRHLFGDDNVFVALQSNEKFPEEGFEVDVQSKLSSKLILL